MADAKILVRKAVEHNLKGIDVDIPRDVLCTVTGVSGSGKSSLAFDTIFREGQRRFLESLSAYARQFLGQMEKPRVERVEGLSPAVSIDQKGMSRNPRSTVGTITEVYDFLRLLFARLGVPHDPETGEPIRGRTPGQITDAILRDADGEAVMVLAPIVKDRKGEYRKELEDLRLRGYVRARIDGEVRRLEEVERLERYKRHSIEIIVDRMRVSEEKRGRVAEAVEMALDEGGGSMMLLAGEDVRHFGTVLSSAATGFTVPELEPRLFSFNSPHGQCPECSGLGWVDRIDPERVVADPALSVHEGVLAPLGPDLTIPYIGFDRQKLRRVASDLGFSLRDPWRSLTPKQKRVLLHGEPEPKKRARGRGRKKRRFRGILPLLDWVYGATRHPKLAPFARSGPCEPCDGTRLNPAARSVLFSGRGIAEVAALPVDEAFAWVEALELEGSAREIGEPILGEIRDRLRFLRDVGLSYLTLDRSAATLSGGEAQRIRLASQVGSGLRGVLYVLDEPSIGLHARDNRRLLATLQRLRDLGNTVLVVEHDEETMVASDHVVDLGPGAGRRGGELVAEGTVEDLLDAERSVTGQYLRGERSIETPSERRSPGEAIVRIEGARHHNLRAIDVDIPVGLFTCVTGVSGSGKSSLVHGILVPAARAALQGGRETSGEHRDVRGLDHFDKVIEIEQSPIGRTPRSNPATYTKVFDEIRKLFAATNEARARGYRPGRFSFNVAGGRCEECQGAGVLEIEMQFLANVQVPCPSCRGRRFNAETLDIRFKGRSVTEVLELTVDEALAVFENFPKIARILRTLRDVGLGYVHLGQPSTTLSGGEAQRIKLAAELARPSTGRTLYVLDEPTTGLHFEDIRRLVRSLRDLVDRGNTVVVIEHNLDVVKTADWILDLGPEGGAAGGDLVAAGTPETVMRERGSHTGKALRRHLNRNGLPRVARKKPPRKRRGIRVVGARIHNLRSVSVSIPEDRMTVVTGVSGSGKSSLAFDTLFTEGQRRFVESMSTYARRFLGRLDRAPVDRFEGLRPAIAIDQKAPSRNPRSTVATTTEIHDYLRLLWARIGRQHCPETGEELRVFRPGDAARALQSGAKGKKVELLAPLFLPGKSVPLACRSAREAASARDDLRERGFLRVRIGGEVHRLERAPDPGKGDPVFLVVDRVEPGKTGRTRIADSFEQAFAEGRGLAAALVEGEEGITWFPQMPYCVASDYRGEDELEPRMFSFNSHVGACPRCDGIGLTGKKRPVVCESCGGGRLRAGPLAVRVGGRSIAEVSGLTVSEALAFFEGLRLRATERKIAAQALQEIRNRLSFLVRVGLEYLTLDRRSNTLAGGEAQRIRLATQIGNRLAGVLYVLDEPTVGLHPRDTDRLLATLRELRDQGNTIVVVEHDPLFLRGADHLIDMGPGAGTRGGEVVATGSLETIRRSLRSLTGAYLSGRRTFPVRAARRAGTGGSIRVRGARAHNLRGIDVEFGLGMFHAVSGVSGGGKSSLVMDVLHPNVLEAKKSRPRFQHCDAVEGADTIDRVVVVDQQPIGRSPASTPATYSGAMDGIRELFAELPLSRMKGWGKERFSTHVGGGRCPTCSGLGAIRVEMHFLSDVWVRCDDCRGRRFDEETLRARFRGHSIADVLALPITRARELFENVPRIARVLTTLDDVGLGYLELGQSCTDLSGGESQRLKLAAELAATGRGRNLYLLDEPTTGLHFADVHRLLEVFDRLVSAGHTLVVIEHNLDVLRAADRIVDLGPEGGDGGGTIVACGTPEEVAAAAASYTGRYLAQERASPPPATRRKPAARRAPSPRRTSRSRSAR